MRAKINILLVVISILSLPVLAQVSAAAVPGQTAAAVPDPAQSALPSPAVDPVQRRIQTIRYGIESELLELFKALGSEKEQRYNQDILAVYDASTSTRLRVAVLELFKGFGWDGAETRALETLKARDEADVQVVAAALGYLGEIKSTKALEFAPALIEEDNKALLGPLVTLLGRAGKESEETMLLAWLDGDAPTPALREASIRALGDIGSTKAGPKLVAILDNASAPKFERIYASEALSKIRYREGVPSLIKAANGEDTTVQVAAIEALGAFDGPEVDRTLVESLRSSYPKSRIAACKAIARRMLVQALPNLEYKATSDPDKGVKTEALRAIAMLGGSEAFTFIASIMEDRRGEAAMRVLAFGLLARKDAAQRMGSLLAILSEESKTLDRALYTALVREIAAASDAPGLAPLARFLFADKDYLIRIGGLEWVRSAKAGDMRKDVEALAAGDPAEAVRRRAADILTLLP
jgi:HEAT repeat protein